MSTTPELGHDIDAYCISCKMMLAHTVIAKVGDVVKRVKCNTCNKEHVYRSSASKSTRKKSTTAKKASKPRARAIATQFNNLLDGRSVEDALVYSPKMELVLSDLIAHPNFGLGVVSQIKGSGKAEVVFPEQIKVLIFGR